MQGKLPENYQLSPRKQCILKAIIDAYITYGEPVGSKYLAENQQLSCSSATIRNEMAELEALGLLEQPHTSAGRIPSELGYRYYVNSLLEQYRMTSGEIDTITESLETKLAEMDQLLSEASRIAAAATNYTGIAVKRRETTATVSRFESVRVDAYRMVLVMLMEDGAAVTRSLTTPLPMTAEEQARLIALMNEKLAGVPADGFSLSLIGEIERGMGRLGVLVSPLVRKVYEAILEADGPHTAVEGVNHLLQYPEYSDRETLRSLLHVLENKEELRSLVPLEEEDAEGINVCIGSENTVKVMKNSTLVYHSIRRDGRVIGAIGVIGPRRMDYSRVIDVIERLAARIDDMLSGGDDTNFLLKG